MSNLKATRQMYKPRWLSKVDLAERNRPPVSPVPDSIQRMRDQIPEPKPVVNIEILGVGDLGKKISATKQSKLRKAPDYGGDCPKWMTINATPALVPPLHSAEVMGLVTSGSMSPTLLQKIWQPSLDPRDYPWSTIGKVFVGIGDGSNWRNAIIGTGSGVLVGRKTLLTAGHVAPWARAASGGSWWMRFVPGYHWGAETLGASFVRSFWGFQGSRGVTGGDIVVCELYTPLGDANGWMGRAAWPNDQDQYEKQYCISAGYPNAISRGQVMVVREDARIVDVDDGENNGLELETAPFTSPGWSGGPLAAYVGDYPFPLVLGVCEGTEPEVDVQLTLSGVSVSINDHSVFTGGQMLLDVIKHAERSW